MAQQHVLLFLNSSFHLKSRNVLFPLSKVAQFCCKASDFNSSQSVIHTLERYAGQVAEAAVTALQGALKRRAHTSLCFAHSGWSDK